MPEEVIPPAPLPFGFRRVSIEEAIELADRERSVEWHQKAAFPYVANLCRRNMPGVKSMCT